MAGPSKNAGGEYPDRAPIVLFVYNRPHHTRKTIAALRANDFAEQSDLIVFSDGAKDAHALAAVKEVRDLLKEISGFKSVSIIERPENYGLAKSIIDGVTSICNLYGRVIVMEDDLMTSQHFLRYMNDALELYEATESVISIHGYVYPVREILPVTFFLRGADCWGWATWKRGWDLFEPDATKLLSALQASGETATFNFDGTFDYAGMLRQQVEGKVNSWAILWHASAFLANKLTLYPGASLVLNIGNDDSGTHSKRTGVFGDHVTLDPIPVHDIPLQASKPAYKAISRYFASIRPSPWQHVRGRVAALLGK